MPSQPEEPMAVPPIVNTQNMPMMGNDNNEMPIGNDMGNIQDNDGNPFDTNFDAGVEADEETDPKKYIQQLTGKLSQSLRSYNENLPQPDADLDKYVAGMILKQAIEGLSPEDANEILDKVKDGNTEETLEEPQGQMHQQDDSQSFEDGGMDESISKFNKRKLDEIFNQVMNNKDDADDMQKPITDIGYKKKPFTSPNFK